MGSQRTFDYCYLSPAPVMFELYAITIRLINEIICAIMPARTLIWKIIYKYILYSILLMRGRSGHLDNEQSQRNP